MTMPGLTGDKLAQSLLEIRQDLPVILCTGYSKKLLDGSGTAFNIKRFKKTVLIEELSQTVQNVLDGVKNRTQE